MQPDSNPVLHGFSQGACLTAEYTARHTRHYRSVEVLSDGLIGPEGTTRDYGGALEGTTVFLGCSNCDPHVPVERVHETADEMKRLGSEVTERIYEGMGHTVNDDEVAFVRRLLHALLQSEG